MFPWRLALMVLGIAVYAVASHWMMLYHAAAPWALLLLLGPLLATALGLATSRMGAWGVVPVLALMLGMLAMASGGDAATSANRLYALQHVGIYALLAGWFGLSLRGQALSLIGQLAQRLHPLTSDMVVYTRNVTRLWTAYLGAIALASAGVYAMLPFEMWSFFSNVLSPLLVGGLLVGEHVMRYVLHPEFDRVRLADVVRAFQSVTEPGAGPP
jgi:uncharacterized membrane protein